MDTDFNFITEDEPPLIPEVVNADTELAKMTPRKFGQTILNVFGQLGGSQWLFTQATIDPRGFMELLKKILPRQIEMDNLDGLTVILTDQYGNTLEVTAGGGQPVATGGDHPHPRSGQPQIATGGNPTVTESGAKVVLKETFE